MKNKISLKIFVVVITCFFLSGCLNDLFEQKSKKIGGDPQLEFRPLNQVTADNEGSDLDPNEPLRVQLIGKQLSSDLSISFIVDTENSTAIAGTHFNLVTSSPLMLQANSSATEDIEINIIEDSVPNGETRELILVLQDAEGVEAAKNLKTYTLLIEGD